MGREFVRGEARGGWTGFWAVREGRDRLLQRCQ